MKIMWYSDVNSRRDQQEGSTGDGFALRRGPACEPNCVKTKRHAQTQNRWLENSTPSSRSDSNSTTFPASRIKQE
jgi:hypothetical protein